MSSSLRSGFTLIELIVVIAVVAILAAVASPMVFRHVGDARSTAARAHIETLALALDAYRMDTFSYPTSAQGLAALEQPPATATGWRGPYLRRGVPLDPWGRTFLYLSPGDTNPATYDLRSLGRDGTPGGDGEDADVTSWGRQ